MQQMHPAFSQAFHNWYSTLPLVYNVYALVEFRKGKVSNKRRQGEGHEPILSIHEMCGRKFAVIDLLARIPDLYPDLRRYGHTVAASRCNFEVTIQIPTGHRSYKWRIHGAPSTLELEKILYRASIRETINNHQVTYAEPLDTHEIGDAYLAAYAMSMLS